MRNTTPQAIARGLYRFLGSLGLATVLFLLLLLLTFLGTLEQKDHGLYAAQAKYFQSFFLVHRFYGVVPMALPGGYLLLILLFVNTLTGGVIRVWGRWRRIGLFVTHSGILVLLAGGWITAAWGYEGHLTLYEGERARVFESYHDWELVIAEHAGDGAITEHVVPDAFFDDLGPDEERVVRSPDLPFDVTLSRFVENATPVEVVDRPPEEARAVDGFYLRRLPPEKENERNVPGVYLRVEDGEARGDGEFLLWGLQQAPAAYEPKERTWTFDLRRRQWELPFEIALDDFTRELHPGTNMPSAFRSTVTKLEDGVAQKARIAMNEPLRHRGYTLYQASWGPQDAGPGDRLYSTFAVVRNPADAFPMYACILITLGMALHYGIGLTRHLRGQTGETA